MAVTLYAVWEARVLTMGEAVGTDEKTRSIPWTVVEGDEWTVDFITNHDGDAALTSGEISAAEDGGCTNTTLTTTVCGEGSGSFWWKVSCEGMDDELGEWYDYAVFAVDGEEVARIAGDSGWQKVEYEVTGNKFHVLSWTFIRDDWDEPDADWENALWLDEFAWTKVLTLADVASVDEASAMLPWTTGGDAEWTIETDVSAADTKVVPPSAKSGVVTEGQSSWIEVSVEGPGTAAFMWNVQGRIYRDNLVAYATVKVDGEERAQEYKTDGWKAESLEIDGEGTHTIRWTYLRTSARSVDGDCTWLDGFSWTPPCGHPTTNVVNALEATCTEAGYTGDKVCAECGEVIETGTAIPALGHVEGVGVVTKEPTTAEEGVMTYCCTRCGAELRTEAIAKLPRPGVHNVVARQRRPGDGLVEISCNVLGVEGKSDAFKFVVEAVVPDSSEVVKATHFWVVRDGANSTDYEVHTSGDYQLLWDAKADLGEVAYGNMIVRVTVVDPHGKVQLWEGGPCWATTNIGAGESWEYGCYFWWGDTVGYKREGNAWIASDRSSSNFSFDTSHAPTYNKGVDALRGEEWITAEGVLAPAHDAAHIHWGGDWRMPMEQEIDDLNSKCDWIWMAMNGIDGYVVRGRGDYASASIFLPCAGFGSGTSLEKAGSSGLYWSSVSKSDNEHSWYFRFNSSDHYADDKYRYRGLSVRPVQGFTNEMSGDSVAFQLDTRIESTGSPEFTGEVYTFWYDGADDCGMDRIEASRKDSPTWRSYYVEVNGVKEPAMHGTESYAFPVMIAAGETFEAEVVHGTSTDAHIKSVYVMTDAQMLNKFKESEEWLEGENESMDQLWSGGAVATRAWVVVEQNNVTTGTRYPIDLSQQPVVNLQRGNNTYYNNRFYNPADGNGGLSSTWTVESYANALGVSLSGVRYVTASVNYTVRIKGGAVFPGRVWNICDPYNTPEFDDGDLLEDIEDNGGLEEAVDAPGLFLVLPEAPAAPSGVDVGEKGTVEESGGGYVVEAKAGETLTEADFTFGVTKEAYVVNIAAGGKSATVALKSPEVRRLEDKPPYQGGGIEEDVGEDAEDSAGVLASVEDVVAKHGESAIKAKPTPKSGETVGALPVKTYEGLYYQAAWGDDLGTMTQGEKVQATGDTLYLGVIKQKGNKGFYKITVSEQ